MDRTRLLGVATATVVASAALAGCTGSGSGAHDESVFDVKPGKCFVAPKDVMVELSKLSSVTCSKAHTLESYASVTYTGSSAASAPSGGGAYPGNDALTKFAQGACAQRFTGYVGVDYLDSALYFTYLLPSARSWEQDDDRTVLCFVTTTGGTLKSSVKGSKK
jgi:hypothetical protein